MLTIDIDLVYVLLTIVSPFLLIWFGFSLCSCVGVRKYLLLYRLLHTVVDRHKNDPHLNFPFFFDPET